MNLSCECECDDPGDSKWFYYDVSDFKAFDASRRKRCCSCKALINKGDPCLEFARARCAKNDIEERIYGEEEIILASYWMCEFCGEIYLNLSDLGFCINIENPMIGYLEEYQKMTGFKKEVHNGIQRPS